MSISERVIKAMEIVFQLSNIEDLSYIYPKP